MMDERNPRAGGAADPDDEEVRRLLEKAGRRAPIPREDLAAISSAARLAWRSKLRSSAGRVPRTGARLLLAAVAAVLALALAVVLWRVSDPGASRHAVALLETAAGDLAIQLPPDGPRPLEAGEAIPIGAVLRTGGAGQESPASASLRLSSGSRLRLDAATEVRFLSPSSLELRDGALYADTGGDRGERTALEIATPLGTVRDVGTRFALRLLSAAGQALQVRVRAGTVIVEGTGDAVRGTAGEELIVRVDGTVERGKVLPYGPPWEWVLEAGPSLELQGQNIGDVLDWMAEETGWEVRFEDAELARSVREMSFVSGPEVRPDGVPSYLPTAGLEAELEEGVLVVHRASDGLTTPM